MSRRFELANDASGRVALSICEGLLFALIDRKIIEVGDARDLLSDVIAAHTEAAQNSPATHGTGVELAEGILRGLVG